MDNDTECADQCEGEEAQWQQAAEHLVQQKPGELDHYQRVHLAFAGGAFAEARGHFQHPQRMVAAEHEVHQDLEALTIKPAGQFLEQQAGQHEEAAHGVGQAHRQEGLGEPDAAIGYHVPPAAGQAGIVAALDMAAGDREFVIAVLQGAQHHRQAGFVVLQITVDHRDVFGGGRERAFDDGGGEAAAADAADAAHPAVALGDAADFLGGAVGAVVVNIDHLPGDAAKRGVKLGDHGRDVRPFVEAGHDHAESWRAIRLVGRRGFTWDCGVRHNVPIDVARSPGGDYKACARGQCKYA